LTRVREEGGFDIATGIIIVFVTLVLGFAALQIVDVQTHQTGHEQAGEAAFNLAESALDAEASQLMMSWPSSAPGWTATCNQATAPATGCPGTSLTSSFNSTYAGVQFRNPVWQVQVLGVTPGGLSATYYNDALASAAPHYDPSGSNKLWIRAQATVAGQTRVVAAEVSRQTHVISLPHNVITAGGVYTSNNGNKIIIESKDPNSGLTGPVALRCTIGPGGPSITDPCAGWDASHGQLDPAGNYQDGYTNPNGTYQALAPQDLQSLIDTAQSNGTLYNGVCPPAGQSGVVVVENISCSYTANMTWNSATAPGMLIFTNGTVDFNGTLNFYGIIYMADQQGAPGPCTSSKLSQDGTVFTVHGNGTLFGALFVDNCGVVDAGSSAFNIEYDSSAWMGAAAYNTPALAKNTFQVVAHS
jgi:Tfp pilus assembly protein PilX